MRTDVETWRARILAEIREMEADSAAASDTRAPAPLDQQSVGRLSRMDAMERQAMALATERRRSARLKRLSEALERVAADEFGWCAECGEAIHERRLAIDLTARLCIRCANGA